MPLTKTCQPEFGNDHLPSTSFHQSALSEDVVIPIDKAKGPKET